MKSQLCISALAIVLTAGTVHAKAHDQGVADGSSPESTSETVQSLEGPGVSSVVGSGQRGDAASEAKSENRVDPVVDNGKNDE